MCAYMCQNFNLLQEKLRLEWLSTHYTQTAIYNSTGSDLNKLKTKQLHKMNTFMKDFSFRINGSEYNLKASICVQESVAI